MVIYLLSGIAFVRSGLQHHGDLSGFSALFKKVSNMVAGGPNSPDSGNDLSYYTEYINSMSSMYAALLHHSFRSDRFPSQENLINLKIFCHGNIAESIWFIKSFALQRFLLFFRIVCVKFMSWTWQSSGEGRITRLLTSTALILDKIFSLRMSQFCHFTLFVGLSFFTL